ncbi:DUF2226 domain-containing protein [Thermococcus sp.]
MKLPAVQPIEENYLCKNREEFSALVKRTLSDRTGGAFFKIFGKVDSEPYYVTLLVDREKVLAIEVEDVEGGSVLMGKPALELLRDMLSSPVIVDAYPLNEIEVKLSIADNIEIYKSTPKMLLRNVCPSLFSNAEEISPKIPEKKDEEVSKKKEEKKKFRPEIIINVPPNIEPYARKFADRIIKYANSLGVTVKKVRIDAKEVRYALGAGKGIHSTVQIEGTSKSHLPYPRLKEEIEKFTWREASELSEALGEKVVVSGVRLKL